MTKISKRKRKDAKHNSCAGKQSKGEIGGLDLMSDELKQSLLDR
jgi:hypothetical protein